MRQNGFTLIELLAAMLAGSILLISIGWTTGLLGREIKPGPAEREIISVTRLAPTFKRLVENALPPQEGHEPLTVETKQIGGTLFAPMALGAAGPVHMTLRVKREGGGEALYASVEPAGADQLPDAATLPIQLATGFRSISFISQPGDSPARQVIQILVQGREKRSLWAATRITSTGSCVFDAISMTCR